MAFSMLQPEGAPTGLGNWSHAGVIDLAQAERLIVISGQTPHDERGALIGEGDFKAQFERVFLNLRLVVEAAGAAMTDVVAFRTYLTRTEDIQSFRAMRDESLRSIFGGGPYPGNTLLVVTALVTPEVWLEIEALACTGGSTRRD